MERDLNMGQRVLSIIVLAFVVFFLMHPISFYLPIDKLFKSRKPFKVTLDLSVVPVIGVLVLLAAGSIEGQDIAAGIVGDKRLQPYAVIILFFALAYLCLSLDVTGIFDWLAIKTILSAKGSGKRLFLAIFVLSTLMTIITSNDIVILTLTQIILSLARISKSDPLPFLILEFFMANIWSAFFLIGNATNIIVAEAYGITFVEYLQWMVLPTIFAGFTAFGIIWFRFRGMIPDSIPVPDIKADDFFKDKLGGLIGTLCVLGRLIVLFASGSITQVPIFALTLIFAGIMLIRDIIYDCVNGRTLEKTDLSFDKSQPTAETELPKMKDVAVEVPKEDSSSTVSFDSEEKDKKEEDSEKKKNMTTVTVVPNLNPDGTPAKKERKHRNKEKSSVSDNSTTKTLPVTEVPNLEEKEKVKKKKKSFVTPTVLLRMPWKIVPFLLSVFIIVQALIVAGWTNDIAIGFAKAIGDEDTSAAAASATYLLGGVASIACNLFNNQPMTILFTRVLADANYTVAPRSMGGSIFGLILGSNFGANLTPVGALAGIMWYAILNHKGYVLPYSKFISIGFTVMPLAILISCGVLSAELALFPSDFS